ncbi:hypothetical protein [Pyrococcus horikoshii]|uniref:Uncharacterized protein n=1 Tax=Pyrococcus horikoshii (strain ATCC 700860 / DSM 12428 / JCM 9974 / NBRC 100139 / OT-3) TaxID=70601 RepID=O73963_PYRHO|nr:hypothetical protein [Pyrococcus horikoshii]BAA29487.1 66aa long hypothetical protein [Pyrococcus horikoshii OT3]
MWAIKWIRQISMLLFSNLVISCLEFYVKIALLEEIEEILENAESWLIDQEKAKIVEGRALDLMDRG